MTAILFRIGAGEAEPELVTRMLDPNAFDSRPQYTLARDLPLVLHECACGVEWRTADETQRSVVTSLSELAATLALKLAVVDGMISSLRDEQKRNF